MRRHLSVRRIGVALVLLTALSLITTALGGHRRTRPREGQQTVALMTTSAPPPRATSTATATVPSAPVETQPGPAPQLMVTRRPIPVSLPSVPSAARASAAAFVRSYLRFSYGRMSAARLADVTPALRRWLTSPPPLVTRAIRALRPHVESLSLERTAGQWVAVATVDDGVNTYVLSCGLTRTAERWKARSLRVS